MSIRHLCDDELDSILCGERLPAELEAHLHDCLVCRRRRDTFLRAVDAELAKDPDEATLARIREQALAQWQGRPAIVWWRWMAAAAAVIVLSLLPLLRTSRPVTETFNSEAVLAEVDQVLARDPLAVLATGDVVDELAPLAPVDGEGSNS